MRRLTILVSALALVLALVTPVFAQGGIHTVQPGENLYRISLRYGTTINALAAANNLGNTNRIYVGQRLVIPGSTSSPAPGTSAPSSGVHVVQRGETLSRIALRYGVSVQTLASVNGIANASRIYVGQRLTIPGRSGTPATPAQPSTGGQVYVVQRGDTLSAIALRHGVSVWTLASANGISNASLIYVGQRLQIPSGGSTTPNPAPPANAPTSGRWIDVNLSTQRLTAYQGNTAVRSTLVSTGLPRTPTVTGQYRIYVKYASAPMSGPGYYLPGVPYVMYFYRGYGIHGTYWHSNFGRPMSHGCVNLPTSEAQWLYSWAPVGTLVKVHY
ncbi:MAG: LysM peptidoglycan-binding domain-containing protein [Chloroflexi bacterium]|nr:LysM peptidoglycan-binding domain-containing protein [Chloroflexota bacterium]